MKSDAQPTPSSYSLTLRHNTLVNRIQHFTEKSTTFVVGEIFDSFDNYLYCALWCSRLFDGNENVGRTLENLFCLRLSFDAKGSNSGLPIRHTIIERHKKLQVLKVCHKIS